MKKSGNFERFDHGYQINQMMYGQLTPPAYNLDNIDIPVYFFAGNQDLLADPVDTLALIRKLRNCPKLWI